MPNRNEKLISQASKAIDQMKWEIANEFGIHSVQIKLHVLMELLVEKSQHG